MSPRRLVGTALFVGAVSAALASAGPDALLPFRDVAGAATDVSVAFIVDFGGSTPPVVRCVRVPSGTNGYQALTIFTQQENEAAPVYNSSGLLCSINGDPSSGCGLAVSGGYIYWSYWHGTSGTWQYSNTGASAVMQNGNVEGWRFENPGKSNPSDPPPGAAPDYASICGSAVSTTTTSSPASPPTTTGAGPVGSQAVPPTAGPKSLVPPGPSGSSPSTTASAGSSLPPGTSASKGGTAATGPAGQSGSTTVAPSTNSGGQAQSLRATPAAARQGSGNSAAPLIIGGLILAALVVASVVRWRRRPGTQ